MEQKSLDLATASAETLKVTAYDIIVQMQNLQNALNAVQAELQKREQEPKKEK